MAVRARTADLVQPGGASNRTSARLVARTHAHTPAHAALDYSKGESAFASNSAARTANGGLNENRARARSFVPDRRLPVR